MASADLAPARGRDGLPCAPARTCSWAWRACRQPVERDRRPFPRDTLGLALLALGTSHALAYAGCVLFGLGVGNVITLPGLLIEREFPREHFAGIVSLISATNQLAFALAPGLIGILRDATGGYGLGFGLCAVADLLAAAVIVLGGARARRPGASAVGLALAPTARAATEICRPTPATR